MEDVLEFWFHTLKPKDWFAKSDDLDIQITERFRQTYDEVVSGETAHWRDVPEGRLAEIIVLDQFTRNMFRGTAAAFATDSLALALAQEAIRAGDDHILPETQRSFLYMPFMHSESPHIHEIAMDLFRELPTFEYEVKHKAVIDRFGRYPHRNVVLGRTSTAEENEWMKENRGF